MYLSPRKVHRILSDQGITRLYHANTVRTACSFLQTGGLWSRGAAHGAGIDQTAQASDDIDVEAGVWHDVFLDGTDIHGRAARRCVYGPVLFAFDIDMLRTPGAHPVRVTKKNPMYWDLDASPSEHYFESSKALREGYAAGDFGMSITIPSSYGPIPFKAFLKAVYLDNPGLRVEKISVFSAAYGALVASARAGRFLMDRFQVREHRCRDSCICRDQYRALSGDSLWHLFEP